MPESVGMFGNINNNFPFKKLATEAM